MGRWAESRLDKRQMKLAVGMRLTNNSVWWRMANRNVAGVSRTSSCRSDREIVDRQLKNLIGKFQTRSSPLRARCSMPQPLGSMSETTVAVTIHALVCADWPARDPIGERGGVNLCLMSWNDPISELDALGRVTLILFADFTQDHLQRSAIECHQIFKGEHALADLLGHIRVCLFYGLKDLGIHAVF